MAAATAGLRGLTLLTREGCDLCAELLAELQGLAPALGLPAIELRDVDRDPQLLRRYGLRIPVLLLDGQFVCEHRLDVDELRRLLRQR